MSQWCVPWGNQIIPIVADEVKYKVADPKSKYFPNPPRVWGVGESKERPPENHYSKHGLTLSWHGRAIIDEVLGRSGMPRGEDGESPFFPALPVLFAVPMKRARLS